MTHRPETPETKASQEATDWLILLQEDPDDQDVLRRFNDWLERSPTHKAAWTATVHTAGLIGTAPPAFAERWAPSLARREGSGQGPVTTPDPRRSGAAGNTRRGGRRHHWGRRFAALAAAACLAVLFLPGLVLEMRADYTTGTAEIRTLKLDDGSTVVLAPDSAIGVAYGSETRRVDLLAGEAFFEVARDHGRSFQVAVRDVEVSVLGTAFNVLRGDDGLTVGLQHGKVAVSDRAALPPVSEALVAGQFVRVRSTGEVVRGSRPPALIAAWRNGQLIAEDQPMRAVVDRLRRYYEGTIILADGNLADRPVTGVYNLNDPLEALRAIARAHDARVRRITPWVVVISGS